MRLVAMLAVAVVTTGNLKLAHADDPCAGLTWDVRHERTLFARDPQIVTAEQVLVALPTLAPDKLYQLALRKESEVTFVTPPGKKTPTEGSYAGLATQRGALPGHRAGIEVSGLSTADASLW